ncbi:unnamed protein product [Adineta steineri]|uniref:Carrier domain-containing protein n=1 Tax=Adineta steineri TaxID=433720 RepID=A0A814MR42_9BILA|nr:unnamed protein product [Adineta steineri]
MFVFEVDGRKDHQIKLHGQRIELGEIERCLLNITSISACVVIKWNDDHLVAYVQSSSYINEEQLREHCQSHLPPHMIPSHFIILDKLPLNQNGKVDRKQLPSPDLSLPTMLSSDKSDTPLTQFEERINTIWCQVLHSNENQISRTTSFFSVGGHSLLFIELYHHYQSVFNFDAHTLSIAPFLQQPTIFQHSQLLQTVIMNDITATQWHTLHINEGVASFAQERIFLDEQVRFSSDIAVYNELFTLQVVQGSLAPDRLLQAFRYVLNKHKILRTSLIFSNDDGILKQCITDIHRTFTITMNQIFENENELQDIIYQTTINPNLFDLSTGHVFHAEIVRHKIALDENENNSNESIMNCDVLLIVFHHAAFDRASSSIFFNDLCLAYNTNTISMEDDESLQYIDYSIHERLMDMTISREFWYLHLEGYNLESRLSLPVDRQRVSNDHRSSSASVTQISFDNEISQSFLDYASIHHVTPFQLGLTLLYAFLFKLTHGKNDLCISCLNANRYKTELQNIMGMFVSTLPYRVQLDPHWSFDELVECVQENCLSILEHSHYPLQHILANVRTDQSNISFLEAMYDFITISSHSDELSLADSSLKQVSFEQSFEVAKFDFMLAFIYNPILENNRLTFRLTCSHDLFDEITVTQIGRRLEYCFQQLFSMQSLNNTQMSFPSPVTCIHHEFAYQVMKHPQKLAVELDEQSLTYCEMLYYVQILSLTLLNEHHVVPGEIVCQCVERSLSMVIGIMAIEMTGGVYCPLSPRDPQHRLHALMQQTQSRLVLVHHLTNIKFDHHLVSLDINSILINNDVMSNVYVDRLSRIIVTLNDIAYVIFTSGSTGIPKALQVRHENFTRYMYSFVSVSTLKNDDVTVQMARSTFDVHLQQIVGVLLIGATLVMLHAKGMADFDYLADVLYKKQITYLNTVPVLFQSFFSFLSQCKKTNVVKYLRSLCSGGDAFTSELISLIQKSNIPNYTLWNLYGPAETTITSTFHLVDIKAATKCVPIGRPLSHYRCMIMNKYLQSSVSSQGGELCIGGVGVFAGYLGRDDLTAKALVEIDGQLFYRTGDLVRMDSNGLLHYQGRKDHQIKLHGQRIELGEIERCLLNITSISACVVMKWNDDYLVAYVQSSAHINEEQLRQHCQSHLPPHMIPSIFVILDKLPLNQNGKVDRKQLPSPQFSTSTLLSSDTADTPLNQFEQRILTIWCQVLHSSENHISRTTSFFSIGGHSLLFIELYHHYQSVFNFDAHTLSIAPFLQQPTIVQHSQLLQTVIMNNIKATQWHTLHINEGIASFAQERIFLDEQVRFSSDIAIYNEVSTLQVVQGPLSLNRLLQAFRYVLNKHKILRTSLIFSNDDGILKQCITDIHKTFTITMNRTFENDNELRDIIYQTTVNPNLFDLLTGHVFHAEILKHQISLNENGNSGNEFITNSDVLLIGFHHAAFDRSSSSIFFNDLCLAYNTNAISIEDDDESLQYIDYSIHERLVDMTTSREFWYLQLEGYDLESRLSLPVDRQRVSNEHRSSSASATQISFDNEISQSFLDYASIHHVTPFQLGLSILYAFLFKLTHGENDLCISSINANRYRNELQNIIGMFVSTLPHRVQLDSQWSLDELVKYVREKCLSILEHSHYPLQHILADLHINQSNISFLEAIYDFITLSSHSGELSLNEASFKQVSFEQSFEVAKFDFMLTFIHNPMLQNNRLSFRLTCSRDLFDETTVTQISRRLEYCFQQLFSLNENMDRIHTCFTCISKFNLILPEETQELEDTIFCRQLHIINEGPASFAQIRLYHNESIHFTPYTSQIPIYDMPFVYHLHSHHTLSVQQLRHALHLIFRKHQSLHTSLLFDTEKNLVIQRIIDINDNSRQLFTFIESVYETQEKLNSILYDEKYNPQLFDLAQGLVFRCHLVYYKQIPPNHLLSHKDLLIFNFHHALFDFPSMNIFLHDLNQAYTTGQLLYDDNTNLRYLDYAVIEQQMSKTSASMFWLDVLHDCKLDQPLSLPFDRYRLSNEHQTGRGTSISFDFGQDLSHDFLTYASSNNISPEHLIFAIYFIFLFKLTNGQTDLCLAMNINNNRYRDELKSIIGLFENVIPLRCQLDPHWCFRQLIEHVREITTKSMKYSYFPLQRILDQHPNISKYAFLDTSLKFISYKDNNTIMIGDSQLVPVSSSFNINEDEILRVSEISLSIHHDMNINQLSCKINTSLDLFNRDTAEKISKQFHFVLHRLSASLIDNQTNKPVYELSLILPNEQYLMQSLNNTQMSFSSPVTCIHHEFVCQVMKHPQKLAVELDEQSLTYCELLYYVQVLSLTLLNEYHVFPGEVVCQCVERSLSMVIGIMGIEMAGGVYCPLSPRDPQHRLYILTQQTQSRLVLVHYLTKTKFNDDIISPDIDSMLNITNIDKKGLSSAIVKGDQIAYIIFTSGSTGTPKAVQVRHKNFIGCMHSLVGIDTFNKDNTAVQMARCSFDIHVQEILGESFSSRLAVLITKIDTLTCTVWNLYGPAETTIASTAYRVNMISERQNVPIGQPFGNYRCLIMDEFQQSCITNQDSELFIGGVGVFTGYLGRDDLSAKTFIYINDELFYRTGDLVHVDNKGLIHYVGRKDYQIKLHGQRIELGEIERCLFNIASISACVVIKWGNDHLIAYVQSSHINENELRGHCQSHLPPHMIPSLFVILDKLPLNANGKVDRKLLPPPHFSSTHLTNSIELSLPTNDTELSIHHIWCEILKLKQISTNTNIFTIGGHSLVIMQLFHRYKIEFHLETNSLSITDLFQHPTIIDHTLLIYQTMNVTQNMNDYHWSSLHITKAKASFAQERIFLDEQIRFSSADNNTNNMYVIPLIYRISSVNDHISVSQLQHAFQSILRKYQILRTALSLDINGTIIQHCLDTNTIINDNKSSRLSMIDLPDEEHEQNAIIKKILNQSDLFDLSKGHVINCHILRQHQSNRSFTHNNNDLLTNDDFILFTIHHACFDGASTSIFIRDLSLAYQSNDLLPTDDNSLQYIDYSIHEHIMDIISSQEFWLLELKGCNPTHQLSLPVDRQRSSTNQQRSGLASSAQITFDDEICASFLNYASSHHLTLFQLGLSIFYVFLFKLSHGESDLCISSINANRYRSELVNMIGMFVSTLPYRVELDSQWSFDEIVRYVQEKCLSILEHSHYPLQHILADLHLTQSNVSFLETMFDFITISEDVSGLRLNGVILEQVLLEKPYEMAKFDFSLNFVYNSSSDDKQLCCSFVCSNDLYDERTILTLTQRFKYLCEQLFSSTSMEKPVDTCSTAISRLSLILSSEMKEMQDYVFCRQINVKNRAPASFAQARIWLDERIRFDPDRPQIAIYNMPFVYHLHSHHTLSINQLRHALHLTVNKHPSLHTSLHFDIEKNTLMQRVITHEDKNNNLFSIIETTYETDEQLNEILHDEKRNPHLFDLAQGLVFRFHLVYHKQISSNHLLSHKDLLIFNFHHALFDFPSMKVFHHDLNQAYTTGQLLYDDNTNLRYLDYAVIEQQMSMSGASMFWLDVLHDRLIRSDIPDTERLNLISADLQNVQFLGSPDTPYQLDYIYLPGIYAPNIVFSWCSLKYAVFDHASMSNVQILNSTISYSSFYQINAPNAIIGDIIFHRNNFANAILIGTHFAGIMGWKEGVFLTNADLFVSYTFEESALNFHNYDINSLNFQNLRFPDGSFRSIDSSNLIVDGGAEKGCLSNGSQEIWLSRNNLTRMQISSYNITNLTIIESANNGDCAFFAHAPGESSLIQLIDVQRFSVLIRSEQAACNISAYIGCVEKGWSNISIHISYLQDNNIQINQHEIFSTTLLPKKVNFQTKAIPKQTRMLEIQLISNVVGPLSFCLIDDIEMNIFHTSK